MPLSHNRIGKAAAQEWIDYGLSHPESEETSRLWAVSCLIRAGDYGAAVQRMKKISQTVDRMDLRLGLLMSWIEVETGVYSEAYRLAHLYPTQAPDAEGAKLLQPARCLKAESTENKDWSKVHRSWKHGCVVLV